MKIRPANLFWLLVLMLVTGGFVYALVPAHPDTHGRKLLAETRQSLREQGFKTELADFDFSTTPEMRAREKILKKTAANPGAQSFMNHPELMEAIGTNAAIVVWKQDALKRTLYFRPDDGNLLTWEDLRAGLDENRTDVDAACNAALSGKIAFNLESKGGFAMLLPHLAMLKHLTQILGIREVLALHDGDEGAAFTNLLAATRLTTAWNPEPAEVSHLARFGNANLAYQATWQALQANHWSEEQLARLQREWESANFFTNLAEIVAFQRASTLAAYEHDPEQPLIPPMPYGDFFGKYLLNPYDAWPQFLYQWGQKRGKFHNESDAMLFYRDREIERRKALQATTWQQMRQFPGVTNEILFRSKYVSRAQMMENTRQTTLSYLMRGSSFLGRAAEAEAKRRILITAIALERFRNRHGSYPRTLSLLAPEFLSSVPSDFMDGQPLRYRLMADNHFILYSVGQDCVEDGGKFPTRPKGTEDWQVDTGRIRLQGTDILWPLPAPAESVSARRKQETNEAAARAAASAERARAQELKQEQDRQETVKKLLAMKPPFNRNEPMIEDKPLTHILKNPETCGTNDFSLDELLTLKQIVNGGESDIATFEVPVSFDTLKERGELRLLVDGGAGAELQDCTRATNGDCLLVWNTSYDAYGQHALQAELFYHELTKNWQELDIKGPVAPYYSSNLVQFSEWNSMFSDKGATIYGKLPASNGVFTIELKTPEGQHLKTIHGTTTNGYINEEWNLIDDGGIRYTGSSIQASYTITLPDWGQTQTNHGP